MPWKMLFTRKEVLMCRPSLQDDSLRSSQKSDGATGIIKQPISRALSQMFLFSDRRTYSSSLIALTVTAGILIIYTGIGFLLRNDLISITISSDVSAFVINGVVTLCFFYAAMCSRSIGRRVYLAWIILAIAQLIFTLGDITWAYIEIVLQQNPFPSISDVLYLSWYPLFLVGVLILPSVSLKPNERIKLLLDTGIVLIASIIVFWVLIIAPTIEENAGADTLTVVLAVAYPVMDLVLLFAVVELLFRRLGMQGSEPLLLLAAYPATQIIVDAIYMRQSLEGSYVPGGLLDSGWILAYLLGGLAAIFHADIARRDQSEPIPEIESRYGRLTWPFYLPYVAAGGAFVLLIWSHDNLLSLSFSTLALSVGGIITLVVARQILALPENARLYSEAQAEIAERKQAESEVKRLNEELEHRVEERTSELWATNIELQREIAERKQAKTALAESQRRLSDIINFLPDATFVIDSEGRVIAWNHAIEAMTGIKAGTILGKGSYEYALPFYGERRPILIDLVFNSDQESKKRYINLKRLDNGALVGETNLLSLKGREAYLLASSAPLYDSDGSISGAIESIRDITENKHAEENLQRSKEAAEAATRAKSAFLANMSHEIRTPMNAVIGMTGLLLETEMAQEQRDYAETIRASGDALLAVINDILDFSKIKGDKLDLENLPFDLRACVEESLDQVAPAAAGKGLELAYVMQEVPERVVGDVARLRQILINLLGNAVKFTETGEVVLSVHVASADKEMVELHFIVEDTGIGISKSAMSKLFQSFSQVDSSTTRQYGGTGLGLAISKRLVELMGGQIWAESRPGSGSIFHFTIVAEAIGFQKDTVPQVLIGKRVLVVYDNKSVRSLLARVIRSWGMEPIEAGSVQEALETLHRETFDIALLDAVMPEMEDLARIQEIKKKSALGPLVVVISPIGQSTLRDSSVAGCLAKPVKPLQLRSLLERLVSPDGSQKALPEVSPCKNVPVSRNLSILIAEDNLVNQKVAMRMLGKLGYNADIAANGLEVLQALDRQPYDVVFMDIQMPEMDGLEATRQIRRSGLKTRIIAMTAYALKEDREVCIDVGMDDYISKPIKMEALKKSLERSCEILMDR